MKTDSTIHSVSDTALWVATYRAFESEREDALFKDPLARTLTGDRGIQIAKAMGFEKIMSSAIVTRTVAIDRLILQALSEGVDTVINLGAGLDTRPYRMQIPKNLKWVEVDFPRMIDYKVEKLKDQTPVCQLDRISVDLSQRELAQKVFKDLGGRTKKALIITEGVLPYLTNEQVENLIQDLGQISSFQFWIQDYRNGGYARTTPPKWKALMKDSPFRFCVENWLEFFAARGWKTKEVIYNSAEAIRIHRPFPFMFPWSFLIQILPKKYKEKFTQISGNVLLYRSK